MQRIYCHKSLSAMWKYRACSSCGVADSVAEKIIVAMSGGVDSSVAAMLLADEGADVHGLFMRTGVTVGRGAARTCCSAADAEDARRVADVLGIRFHVLNFSRDFDKLIADFLASYRRGRTPNPCIVCNDVLKFGKLLAYADSLGASKVATGHYARVERRQRRWALRRARTCTKDQTYVLAALSQDQLARAAFPVGDLEKEDVRNLARRRGLPVSEKGESQDICFVPGGDYRELLRESAIPLHPGKMVDSSGAVLGDHEGIELFTIGQRRGLGRAFGEPRYVLRINPDRREVVVGPGEELYERELRTGRINWVSCAPTPEPFRADVQIRYQHKAAPADVAVDDNDCAAVTFDDPQRAITPGQLAVVYQDEYVAAAGWIEEPKE